MMKKNRPDIRFGGFIDDWELCQFENIVDVRSGRDYKHLNEGDIPVYGTGGYMLSVDESLSKNEDAVGIGRKGTIDKPYLLKAPFWTVDTLFYAIPRKNYVLEFVHSIFNTINWRKYDESTGVPSLSKSTINSVICSVPVYEEQTQIANFFQTLDKFIAIHERELDNYKLLKKGFLQKLFPSNDETNPSIRFKGFTEAWEQRKLGDVTEISTGKLDANAMVENGEFDFYTSGMKKYKIDTPAFKGPAITVAGNGATVGYMHLADGKFNAYQRTYVLEGFKADRQYVYSEVSNMLPRKIAEEARTGNIPYIVMSMLTDLMINLPISKEEQKQIGKLFRNLDKIISIHQHELDSYTELKKGFQQKMFL